MKKKKVRNNKKAKGEREWNKEERKIETMKERIKKRENQKRTMEYMEKEKRIKIERKRKGECIREPCSEE